MSDWRDEAACVGQDPECWFPAVADKVVRDLAKRICASCPVIVECEAYARRIRPQYGIWAGRERTVKGGRYATVGRPLMPCGTAAAYRRHANRGEVCRVCERFKRDNRIEGGQAGGRA